MFLVEQPTLERFKFHKSLAVSPSYDLLLCKCMRLGWARGYTGTCRRRSAASCTCPCQPVMGRICSCQLHRQTCRWVTAFAGKAPYGPLGISMHQPSMPPNVAKCLYSEVLTGSFTSRNIWQHQSCEPEWLCANLCSVGYMLAVCHKEHAPRACTVFKLTILSRGICVLRLQPPCVSSISLICRQLVGYAVRPADRPDVASQGWRDTCVHTACWH